MITSDLDSEYNTTVYRHAFPQEGCAEAEFDVNLQFSNNPSTNPPGVWAGAGELPSVGGALGCERVRLLVKRDSSKSLEISELRFETDGCPKMFWKVALLFHLANLYK